VSSGRLIAPSAGFASLEVESKTNSARTEARPASLAGRSCASTTQTQCGNRARRKVRCTSSPRPCLATAAVESLGVDERSRRIEARLELPVIVAALLVIPLIVIEESSYGEPWDSVGIALNWATWLVFVAEAVVMLSVVPDRSRWIREHRSTSPWWC
jgi:hypothetical protein